MLYREIIAVCSEIHTKHRNTLCGQNGELLNVCQNHWTVKKDYKQILLYFSPSQQHLTCLMPRIARGLDTPDWNRAWATQVAKAYTIFVNLTRKKKSKNTGSNYRRNKNIKIGFKELQNKSLKWINLARGRLQWRDLVHSEQSFGFYTIFENCHCSSLRPLSMFFYHPHLGLPSGLLLSDFSHQSNAYVSSCSISPPNNNRWAVQVTQTLPYGCLQ